MTLTTTWELLKLHVLAGKVVLYYFEDYDKYVLIGKNPAFELHCGLSKSPSDVTDLNDFVTNFKNGAL